MTISTPGDLVIGIDSSTTAVKAIAWDLQGREVCAARSPLHTLTPYPGFFEQNADEWWRATCTALQTILSSIQPDHVRGIAVAHQRETFVPIGSDHRPLRPAILWMDQRAQSLLSGLTPLTERANFHQRTGKPLSANLAPPKIEWLRLHEPDIYARAAYWLDTHAYLVFKLTGELVTSAGSADPLGLFDLAHLCWDAGILERLNLNPACFPIVVAPGTKVGSITRLASVETGLKAGTPVAAGLGDGQAAALGLGINKPGTVSLSLGTSVIGGTFSNEFKTSLAFRTMSGADGTYIFETVILSGTQILNWLVQDILRREDPILALSELEHSAVKLTAGSEGLVLVPYWNGAMNPYWDPTASGILVGLRGHHQSAHMYRAALEGIAFELRLHLEGVEQELSAPIQTVFATGGGIRSSLWLQIIADVLNKPVYSKEESEAAALGAGMLAAVGAGCFASAMDASQSMTGPTKSLYQPSATNTHVYANLYSRVYKQLYPAIRAELQELHPYI